MEVGYVMTDEYVILPQDVSFVVKSSYGIFIY
jgi:hypothetical protein